MNFAEHQELLVAGINSAIAATAEKAAEYPDDPRYIDSSRALSSLAVRLKELPPDHPKLRELWRLQCELRQLEGSNEFEPSFNYTYAQGKLLARYGLNSPEEGDPDEFLTELIAAFQHEMASFVPRTWRNIITTPNLEPDDMDKPH